MTRNDQLDEALSVVADVREGGMGRGRAFGNAVLRTMSRAGDFHVGLTVPVYPRDAPRRDLERIGKDMHGATQAYAETQKARQG